MAKVTDKPKYIRKSKQLGVSVDPETLKKFELLAKLEERTISNYIQFLIKKEVRNRQDDIDKELNRQKT